MDGGGKRPAAPGALRAGAGSADRQQRLRHARDRQIRGAVDDPATRYAAWVTRGVDWRLRPCTGSGLLWRGSWNTNRTEFLPCAISQMKRASACFHFIRAFKVSEGVTPHGWIVARRLEKAVALLLDGQTSVTDTAIFAGYSSAAHFIDGFHRTLGVTPGQLRSASLAD